MAATSWRPGLDPGARVELLELADAGADPRRKLSAAGAEVPAPDPFDPLDAWRETDVEDGAEGPELD